jgi:hypothetical protein
MFDSAFPVVTEEIEAQTVFLRICYGNERCAE